MGTGSCGVRAALQPDGKIVAVASCGSNNRLLLLRYLADGSLDASFGKGGIAVTSINGIVEGVALQTGGKIVSSVIFNGIFGNQPSGVVRFNSNGTLDGTFGKGGVATVPLPHGETTVLVVQADNRIVLGADVMFATREKVGLVRLLPNGTLDSTFGNNGFAFVNESARVTALALAQDGTIDALVSAPNTVNGIYGVHFSTNGAFIEAPPSGNLVAITSEDRFSLMTFQLDAKILFVNGPNPESSSAPQNLRFTKFNAPDPNFQQPQYFLGSTGGAIIVEPDGGILSAGGNGTNSFQFALARFNPNGSLDSGFGSGGSVETAFFPGFASGFVQALLLQPDGKIVAVGQAFNYHATQGGIALARYFGP